MRTAILQNPIPIDANSLKLRQFILNAGSMSDDAYEAYIHALPNQFKELPQELEPGKTRMLISNKKITFTKANFDVIADSQDLRINFRQKQHPYVS